MTALQLACALRVHQAVLLESEPVFSAVRLGPTKCILSEPAIPLLSTSAKAAVLQAPTISFKLLISLEMIVSLQKTVGDAC